MQNARRACRVHVCVCVFDGSGEGLRSHRASTPGQHPVNARSTPGQRPVNAVTHPQAERARGGSVKTVSELQALVGSLQAQVAGLQKRDKLEKVRRAERG